MVVIWTLVYGALLTFAIISLGHLAGGTSSTVPVAWAHGWRWGALGAVFITCVLADIAALRVARSWRDLSYGSVRGYTIGSRIGWVLTLAAILVWVFGSLRLVGFALAALLGLRWVRMSLAITIQQRALAAVGHHDRNTALGLIWSVPAYALLCVWVQQTGDPPEWILGLTLGPPLWAVFYWEFVGKALRRYAR
jgi:hypothetical protein